ncbi:MAG: CotH kinase family protein [Bacteroidota bacterium]|nr:CotH kinase family protein [Bacteroidota bacterium]
MIETGGTTIPDEPKVPVRLGIIRGTADRNFLTDPFTDYDGNVGIELRGNSSQVYDQKQYLFETQDPQGEGVDVPLMEFPKEEDWILYAPFVDKSLMRNALVYETARQLGRYASRTRFCELVIDGDYKGVYVFLEQIKRDKNRVNISKLEAETDSGDELTGGYIIAIDHSGKDTDLGFPGAFDSLGYYVYWHIFPKSKDITWPQRWYIEDFIEAFETAIQAPDFADPQGGYRAYLDVASFVDYILINEWANNVDGFVASLYLHKDRDSKGGKLVAGPVWDFNIAFGNADYSDGTSTTGWRSHYGRVPFWWRRLLADSSFVSELASRWTELRASTLSSASLEHRIDSLVTLLDEAQSRHFNRWQLLGTYVWPNGYVGETWAEEIDYLKSWMRDRMRWMDEHIASISWPPDSIISSVSETIPGMDYAISVWPFPAGSEVTLALHFPAAMNGIVIVRDVLGREVRRCVVEAPDARVQHVGMQLHGLPNGMYHAAMHVGDVVVASTRILIRR